MLPLAHLVAAAASPTTSDPLQTIYVVVGILGALVVVFGAGGLAGLWRSVKKSGIREGQLDQIIASQPSTEQVKERAVRDAQLDSVIVEVLGDGQTKSLRSELSAVNLAVLEIKRTMSPNGLNTNHLGDIAKRTEKAVTELGVDVRKQRADLNEHIGSSRTEHNALWRAVREAPQK